MKHKDKNAKASAADRNAFKKYLRDAGFGASFYDKMDDANLTYGGATSLILAECKKNGGQV